MKDALQKFGGGLPKNCVNNVHQIVFSLLDLLEHDALQASAPSAPLVIILTIATLDLTLNLCNFAPMAGDMEE